MKFLLSRLWKKPIVYKTPIVLAVKSHLANIYIQMLRAKGIDLPLCENISKEYIFILFDKYTCQIINKPHVDVVQTDIEDMDKIIISTNRKFEHFKSMYEQHYTLKTILYQYFFKYSLFISIALFTISILLWISVIL